MLYIIVPVFNRLKSTKKFIESLYSQSYKEYTIIIVDDGSTDGTAEFIEKKYPEVIIVHGTGDLYWGGGINKGLDFIQDKLVQGDLIAFANNDVEFKEDTIIRLLCYFENNMRCLYHPITVNKSNFCVSSGSKILQWGLFLTQNPFRGNPYDEISSFEPVEIDFATARFLLFDSELLKLVKGIDTKNFIHYGGDNDFSMQFKLMGIPTYIIPSSSIILDTATTGANPQTISTLKSFFKSLSSINSTNNLKVRFTIGSKYCPKVMLPFYYVSVMLQVLILNLRKK